MTSVQRTRLRAIADFLRKKEFNGIKRFHFAHYVNECEVDSEGHICGSSACAIGFMPLIFPDRFQYFLNSGPIDLLSGSHIGWNGDEVKEFLGITEGEFDELFTPSGPMGLRVVITTRFGTFKAHGDASPETVADNIDKFLDWKGSKAEFKYYYKCISWKRPFKKIEAFVNWMNQ